MVTWICCECGKKSPDDYVDDLVDMGWSKTQFYVNGKYYRLDCCPNHLQEFIQKINKTIPSKETDNNLESGK